MAWDRKSFSREGKTRDHRVLGPVAIMESKRFNLSRTSFWAILVFLVPVSVWGGNRTVRLPVNLEYSLICSMLIRRVYTLPGERAIPVDQDSGRRRIEIWKPVVSAEGSLVKVGSDIKIRAGLPVERGCSHVVEWVGYIEILQRVWLDEKDWKLRFETVGSRLYDRGRRPTTIASIFLKLVETDLYAYMDQVTIDLNLPVRALQAFLPLNFLPARRKSVKDWLNTMRPGKVRVEAESVSLDILMDVEVHPQPEKAAEELAIKDVQALIKAWEDWDAFLILEIESLIGQPLTESERTDILEVLLDTRHGFVRECTERRLGRDFIREQFISTWQRLARILRKYLIWGPSDSLMRYLAFFTAADAVAVLDQLGPALGMEISRDGLVRLARLLKGGEIDPCLDYSSALNPRLRKLLGLGPPLDEPVPDLDAEEIDPSVEPDGNDGAWHRIWLKAAFASGRPGKAAEIKKWIPPNHDVEQYLNRVKKVLEQAAEGVLSQDEIGAKYQQLYRLLVLATAWQESCWRQFEQSEGKVRYLLSYNNSSVGLMQINQHVWRGIYRVESLRWNIRYNARAGSEILDIYLRKYALRRLEAENTFDNDTLARLVYAMYNGGPGEFDKFLTRKQRDSLYASDRLFWQKYSWTKAGKFDKVFLCLRTK